MPSTIHYNINRHLLIAFNFFLVLGISTTNYSASAQSNKSIALPTKKSTSTKASSSSTSPSKQMCRNKAKEASKIVFDDCMILVKENEADNIRKEYKAKVIKLKAQYEQKLKKVLSQLKKQSKTGVVPATSDASTTNPNSATTLPPKTQNDIPVSEDTNNTVFATPTPINTQDSFATEESNSMATTQNSTMTTKKAMTPEFADEPSVQLKQIPQSADAPVLEPEPATNDYPSSSYLPSDKLEGEPDSAI